MYWTISPGTPVIAGRNGASPGGCDTGWGCSVCEAAGRHFEFLHCEDLSSFSCAGLCPDLIRRLPARGHGILRVPQCDGQVFACTFPVQLIRLFGPFCQVGEPELRQEARSSPWDSSRPLRSFPIVALPVALICHSGSWLGNGFREQAKLSHELHLVKVECVLFD